MRAISAIILTSVAVTFNASAAPKPDGGTCECGQRIDEPASCRLLSFKDQDTCRKSNASWYQQCVAYQAEVCRIDPLSLRAKDVKFTSWMPPSANFVGVWNGKTVCPKLGAWRFLVTLQQQPSGAYAVKAATEGGGVFRKAVFNGDKITLTYSTVWKDAAYTGRLVSPDRIEGTVKIQEDCTWYLKR
jgi:hypothetical protein